MWKNHLLITSNIILMFINSLTSIDIECNYQVNSYTVIERIYDCRVNNNPNISSKNLNEVTSINEYHVGSRTSNDVLGIWASSKTIHYFPTGFDKFFKNIKAIYIYICGLKEIHQSDLKVFPNLVYIYLSGNAIEVIEDGIFDYNKNLEFIGLNEKNIIHIDSSALNELDKLRYFRGLNVPCIGQDAVDSKDAVKDIIDVIQKNCVSMEFILLNDRLNEIADEANPDKLLAQLEYFEVNFNNSKFMKYRPLNVKLQNLKIIEVSKTEQQKSKTKSSDIQLNDLTDNSKELDDNPNSCKICQNQFIKFALKTEERFQKIEQNLASTRHMIAINLNEKMKEVEKQLMKQLEEILEKKLDRVTDDSQKDDIDVRSGVE
ncbi:unnamed protein product [Chironomus riparius]|uniref:Uncharacterized protein n=1 Tax=Chironomus riparius TaxID=315576 RepID=A0A9N9S3U6_9DIPT|nr:unnamed protein product [Chironomus riparius]